MLLHKLIRAFKNSYNTLLHTIS